VESTIKRRGIIRILLIGAALIALETAYLCYPFDTSRKCRACRAWEALENQRNCPWCGGTGRVSRTVDRTQPDLGGRRWCTVGEEGPGGLFKGHWVGPDYT